MKITKEELAARLNGREYLDEITKDEEAVAKASGLLVVFGYSDDNIEFRGLFSDECGCYGGGRVRFNRTALIQFSDEEEEALRKFDVFDHVTKNAVTVEAAWDSEGYSWTYKTAAPHTSFDIMEDGEKYCRGIVIEFTPTAEREGA